jgi:hypothetical protein
MLISATPIRIFHVIYPLFWGAIYTVFNVLYFTNNGMGPEGHPYAYNIMDWRNPLQSALSCSAGFIFSTIMQGVLYGLYRLRMCIYDRVMNVRYNTVALQNRELLQRQLPVSESESENIVHVNQAKVTSYHSTEPLEREITTSASERERK